jgi:hypothetical protein
VHKIGKNWQKSDLSIRDFSHPQALDLWTPSQDAKNKLFNEIWATKIVMENNNKTKTGGSTSLTPAAAHAEDHRDRARKQTVSITKNVGFQGFFAIFDRF